MERAVLLSDIEFLDGVHESDWERIEEESFLVNVSKPLNENQQVVLELLQKAYAKNKWMTPFGAVFSVANENDFAIRAWLTKEEQFKVLAAFADWEMKEVAEV